MYQSIIDECVFISRASEGAIDTNWIMNQPIRIRKKYVESLTKELKERETKNNKRANPHRKHK